MKLYDAVVKNNDKYRFHTPGHCGKNFDNKIFKSARFDITELDFSDNLQKPDGVIKTAETRVAEIYGAQSALFFSAGATLAVFTALAAVSETCKTVYLYGAAHKSFYNGAKLAGLSAEEYSESADLKNCAVFVTSPDYFGVTIPVETLAKLRKDAKLLVIDSAHGAHYNFSPLLPASHQNLGDLVIMSPHKTLPTLTGGAILFTATEALYDSAVIHRSNMHTTSPSYPILASIEYGTEYMHRAGVGLYDKLFISIEKTKSLLGSQGFKFYENDDFTRLVLELDGQAEKYSKKLAARGVYAELVQDGFLVFIITPFNAKYLKKLVKELIRVKNG